jgi:hypothetical protein
MKYFKKGQTVYHHEYGQGVVTNTNDENERYPIIVKFMSSTISFTEDGRQYEECLITLSQIPFAEVVNKPIEEDTYKPFTLEDDLLGMQVISKDESCKGILLKYTYGCGRGIVTYQDNEKVIIGGYNITYEQLLNYYTSIDGKPCGKL